MVDQPGRVVANPYVGPKPFTAKESEHFFGRNEETRQLFALVIARRTVLFYAQSGAGKTSLIQAALIPRLQQRKRIQVLPISRVGGELPPGLNWDDVHNIYVLNVLLNMQGKEARTQELAGLTLVAGLQPYFEPDQEKSKLHPRLLVLDQLEELFTTYPERYEERAAFFDELRQCLEAYPQLSLLLSMREDYVASMDAYANRMPDYLRTRFRMERLTAEAAMAAVREPAASAGRPFEPGVANNLVDNLSRVQVGRIEKGKHVEAWAQSRYVEPVHLQIVCQQLWDRLPAQSTSISQEDVEQFADVDQALTKFYESALEKVVDNTGLGQHRLRAWFSEQLITPAQTRGLVYRGEEETAGLPNAAVDILASAYVIRGEVRGSDIWYELAHDRLVKPVLEVNQAWREAHQNPLTFAAQQWYDAGEDATLLFTGLELAAAETYAAENPDALSDVEREYLKLSQKETQRQIARRQRLALIGAAVLLIVFALLAVSSFLNAQSASREAELAAIAAVHAVEQQKTAESASTYAVEQKRAAETALSSANALLDLLVTPTPSKNITPTASSTPSATPTPTRPPIIIPTLIIIQPGLTPHIVATIIILPPTAPKPTATASPRPTATPNLAGTATVMAKQTVEYVGTQLAQSEASQQRIDWPEYLEDSTGARMLLIPAGSFIMGNNNSGQVDEQPMRKVTLNSYYIDQFEVTNAQYAAFLNSPDLADLSGRVSLYDFDDSDARISWTRDGWEARSGFADHPVTEVPWEGAKTYCVWRGARLPSEAEWEKAAKGRGRHTYPWGEDLDCKHAHVADCGAPTLPVGSLDAGVSPYGVFDMAGNVWEWVEDWYDPDYYRTARTGFPRGPRDGNTKVVRGGSGTDPGSEARAANRNSDAPGETSGNVGFRCARSP